MLTYSFFDHVVIKVAGNQDRHKSSDEFDFEPLVSMAHLYVFEMRSVVVPYCSSCLCLYFGSSIMLVTYFVNFR